mmetsp:Transcript_39779/g.100271  ORF Transcript_39779/g.100271 Transcript_39779/m.100271 type:complete len:144 (-) Transcript_39779:126-557(-)|eukprot:CAMPEP_0177632298 /NCGR_PEP_ID=MMETSP0447-20121125/2214_1 /TAXON_ID=0 /ORGANISM="Stygamoeba regulata, Strain BSH-02190019" /LENGTH=143 /DNA_ID=CAMNT_0019133851 /DNA_START=79 /DNA_END=510 /DNA_ORIENTATION=-
MESNKTPAVEAAENLQGPREAKMIACLLASMGIEDYEPRVVGQLLEFMHKYSSEVLVEAGLYAEHAGRTGNHLKTSDVRLAIQSRIHNSFIQPPPRQIMMELARHKNSAPLPLIPDNSYGINLPAEELCLTNANFQIVPNTQQ